MFDFPASPVVGQVYAPTGGPVWTWDGTVWKNVQAQGEMQIARTFIPGVQGAVTNYTYTKPFNLRHLEFEGVASGGSGASALATAAATWSHGSGGGGGSWGKKLFAAAALPATVALAIGAPGAASSSGSGLVGGSVTFGSLITLPGGQPGIQGGNVTYTSAGGTAVSSGPTAYPTGVDVGKNGEPSDPTSVGMNVATTTNGTWGLLGKSGGSPWGTGAPMRAGTGGGQEAGQGYGWGSGGCFNAASAALRNSVAAGPGAVLLTEYLAVAPTDTTPRRQTFVVGSAGVNIPVPPTAKMAKFDGVIFPTGALLVYMRVSLDGSTYLSGAGSYYITGLSIYGGSVASPAKNPGTSAPQFAITNSSDNVNFPHCFSGFITTFKNVATQLFVAQWRGVAYNNNATNLMQELLWNGYINDQTTTQLAAIQLIPSAGTFGAGSFVTVEWIY